MLSLEPDSKRRIWLVLDELPSLQTLPSLPDMMAQCREFGGCVVATVQTLAQFYKNFGINGAEEILGVCNTGVHFRSPDKQTSDYVAELLGEHEIEEPSENVSYGVSTVRYGVSVSENKRIRRVVLSTEVRKLNDLEAYLRLKGDWAITRLKFRYKEYVKQAESFVVRGFDDNELLKEIVESVSLEDDKRNSSPKKIDVISTH